MRSVIICTIAVVVLGCQNKTNQNSGHQVDELGKVEEFIEDYMTHLHGVDSLQPLMPFEQLEEFLLLNGILESREPDAYKSFFKEVLFDSLRLDVYNLSDQLDGYLDGLISPVNMGVIAKAFAEASQFDEELDSMDKIGHTALILDDIYFFGPKDSSIQEFNLITSYIESVKAENFKSKIVYRLFPLSYGTYRLVGK